MLLSKPEANKAKQILYTLFLRNTKPNWIANKYQLFFFFLFKWNFWSVLCYFLPIFLFFFSVRPRNILMRLFINLLCHSEKKEKVFRSFFISFNEMIGLWLALCVDGNQPSKGLVSRTFSFFVFFFGRNCVKTHNMKIIISEKLRMKPPKTKRSLRSDNFSIFFSFCNCLFGIWSGRELLGNGLSG